MSGTAAAAAAKPGHAPVVLCARCYIQCRCTSNTFATHAPHCLGARKASPKATNCTAAASRTLWQQPTTSTAAATAIAAAASPCAARACSTPQHSTECVPAYASTCSRRRRMVLRTVTEEAVLQVLKKGTSSNNKHTACCQSKVKLEVWAMSVAHLSLLQPRNVLIPAWPHSCCSTDLCTLAASVTREPARGARQARLRQQQPG